MIGLREYRSITDKSYDWTVFFDTEKTVPPIQNTTVVRPSFFGVKLKIMNLTVCTVAVIYIDSALAY